MDLLLTICLTIYQSSHSVTLIHSSTIKPKESVAICNFSSQNVNNAFNNLLCEFDWNSLIYADANAAYNGFLQKYTEFYNKSFPIKFRRGKNLKTLHNPWLTTGILKSIKTKSRLYKLFLRKPSHEHESNYKSFRNKLTCLVRVARKNIIIMTTNWIRLDQT